MTDPKESWDDVGDRFNDLGRKLKTRFDANAAFSDEQRETVNDALHQMGAAIDAGFSAISETLRDDDVRDDLKQARIAVGDAIASTFNAVAAEIKKAVRK
jgi:hypothetical protein